MAALPAERAVHPDRRAFAVAVLGLASFGVYVGRIVCWNSRAVPVDPRLLSQLGQLALEPGAVAMTTLLAKLLTLSYLVVYSLGRLDGVEEGEVRSRRR